MQKCIKIIAAILGAVLAAATAIFIFFPGLPTHIKVKLKYDYIDRTMEDFQTVYIPDSFKSFTVNGVSFKAPSDAEQNKYTSVSYGEKGAILVTEIDKAELKRAKYHMSDSDDYEYNAWEDYKYEEEDYRHFFDKIGEKFPDPNEVSPELRLFFMDRLTAKDCLKLRTRDKEVFLEFAEVKEKTWGIEESFRFDGDGYTGYVSKPVKGDMFEGTYSVTIFPDGAESKYYFVTLKGGDEETQKQIISSIKLAKTIF